MGATVIYYAALRQDDRRVVGRAQVRRVARRGSGTIRKYALGDVDY